jgi:hypothetical protein
MSAAAAAHPDPVSVYRDDGPLARALGGVLAPVVPLPAPLLILAAVAPLLAAVALAGAGASRPLAAAVLAWAIAAGAASRGRPQSAKAGWAEPPLVRLTEYAGLIWIAALAGPSAYPAAFALLAALAFRHYDLAYRLRHRGVTPAAWVSALAGGWDGRLLVAFALLLAGALPGAYYAAAAILGIAFAGESAAGWLLGSRGQQALEDEYAQEGAE